MATHSSILASVITWTEELSRLQFMGSQTSQTQLSDRARATTRVVQIKQEIMRET